MTNNKYNYFHGRKSNLDDWIEKNQDIFNRCVFNSSWIWDYGINGTKKGQIKPIYISAFDVPKILYKDTNGEEHNYFIDYKMKGTNIVFEIKSTYYWNKLLETNLLKEKAAKELYNYNIIMDNNFKILDKIFNSNT